LAFRRETGGWGGGGWPNRGNAGARLFHSIKKQGGEKPCGGFEGGGSSWFRCYFQVKKAIMGRLVLIPKKNRGMRKKKGPLGSSLRGKNPVWVASQKIGRAELSARLATGEFPNYSKQKFTYDKNSPGEGFPTLSRPTNQTPRGCLRFPA